MWSVLTCRRGLFELFVDDFSPEHQGEFPEAFQAVRSQTTAGLNIVFVEFDWTTEIRAARQTVQERLATLEGILPAGIRPQMTPPASIMGQIVIAGVYRQQGPSGGTLAPIERTSLMAELVCRPEESCRILVWSPTDRHDPSRWEAVEVQTVSWHPNEASREKAEPTGEAALRIDGRDYEVRFQSRAQRQMELRTMAAGSSARDSSRQPESPKCSSKGETGSSTKSWSIRRPCWNTASPCKTWSRHCVKATSTPAAVLRSPARPSGPFEFRDGWDRTREWFSMILRKPP